MIFGHKDKIAFFRGLAKKDALSHSYLFFGPSSVGKGMFAKALANFLERGVFDLPQAPLLNTIFVSPKEDKKSISIDAVSELRKFLAHGAFTAGDATISGAGKPRRVAIIDPVEALGREAQSALLKTVEEPPSRSLIIGVVSDPQALHAPLLSRFTKIHFPSFSKGEIKRFLVENQIIEEKRAEEIAAGSFGKIGRALKLSAAGKRKNILSLEDAPLEAVLEEKIIRLFRQDPIGNAAMISLLLKKETAIRHFNLNEKLQRKAIDLISA